MAEHKKRTIDVVGTAVALKKPKVEATPIKNTHLSSNIWN